MATMWTGQRLADGIHAWTGGEGTRVILLAGWPQTAEAYSDLYPLLSQRHRVFAVDLPGLGQSDTPSCGYDTGAISNLLHDSFRQDSDEPYHLVGHDVGAWVAYSWAAQFPKQVRSLTLLESTLPGLAGPQTFPLPPQLNVKLWQFSFNTLPDLPEILTAGRERELFDWLYNHKAEHPERITRERRDLYVQSYARPGKMSCGFAYYRATPLSSSQNIDFSKEKLQMQVLALGAKTGVGSILLKSMESLAKDVQGGEIEDCGHYVLEEQPEKVAERLLDFFKQVENASR